MAVFTFSPGPRILGLKPEYIVTGGLAILLGVKVSKSIVVHDLQAGWISIDLNLVIYILFYSYLASARLAYSTLLHSYLQKCPINPSLWQPILEHARRHLKE